MPRSPASSALVLVFSSLSLLACASATPPSPNEPTAAPTPASSHSADLATLRTCCADLAQSADTLKPPSAMYAGAAADRCKKDVELVKTEQDQDHLIATLRGELRGTPLPKSCD